MWCWFAGRRAGGARPHTPDMRRPDRRGLLDLQPGPVDRPVVPPMLAADIAGGSFPAVINILLALRARDQSGRGCHIDIAPPTPKSKLQCAQLHLDALHT